MNITLTGLREMILMPDPQAASALDKRMKIWVQLEGMQERSFLERGLIIREFEARKLWSYLDDPETGQPFPNLTAWLSCDSFLGCRRTNFEAKRTMEMLMDVRSDKLMDIPKANLHILTQLSTAVRNQPDVLEAARTLPREAFEEKVEKEHPNQHLPARKAVRFRFTREEAKTLEAWIDFAIENEIAATRDEAIVRAVETAIKDFCE